MTTITQRPQEGNDDGVGGGAYAAQAGNTVVNINPSRPGWIRFPSLAIPAGSTITSAVLRVWPTTNGNPRLRVTGADEDNPTYPVSAADYTARPRTTAEVDTGPQTWTSGSTWDTNDLTSIVQEIIDRPGWVSGNALMLFVTQNDASGTAAYSFRSYENTLGESVRPLLTIAFSEPAESPSGSSTATATATTVGAGSTSRPGASIASASASTVAVGIAREIAYWSEPVTIEVGPDFPWLGTGSFPWVGVGDPPWVGLS